MGIQINGQTDTISSSDGSFTLSGNVGIPSTTELNAAGVTATGLNVTGVSTFTGNIVANGGRIGVGTISPLLPVHVEVPGSGASDAAAVLVKNDSTSFGRSEIQFRSHANNGRVTLVGGAEGSGAGYGTFDLKVWDNSGLNNTYIRAYGESYSNYLSFWTGSAAVATNTEKMRITKDGNVGIGTDNPTSKLEVYNSSSTPVVKISGPTSGSSALEFYASTTKNGALLVNSSGFLIAADNSNPITFNAGGSERLRIGSAGQFGIGGANYGTSGQVLTSQGSGSAPQWASASSTVTSALTLNGSQYVTFTGIPDAVTTIAINYWAAGPVNTTEQFIRVGSSSGLLTSNYSMSRGYFGSSSGGTWQGNNNSWCPNDYYASDNNYHGRAVLTNPVGNNWDIVWFFHEDGSASTGFLKGHVPLGATLDRVAFGFNSGQADSGTVRIEYST